MTFEDYLMERFETLFCLDNPMDLKFKGSIIEESNEGRALVVILAIKCDGDENLANLYPTNPTGLKCRNETEVANLLEDKTIYTLSTET